ncbi:unnamed protein product [Taenia asiatica]|uniref:Uncharacterized protein n=1 Tax=Taenia asiatica TaxID=60517 RepID=A0A0R3VYY7_TAEAS|nr:unnamed protein product [Taenia asiatica]
MPSPILRNARLILLRRRRYQGGTSNPSTNRLIEFFGRLLFLLDVRLFILGRLSIFQRNGRLEQIHYQFSSHLSICYHGGGEET